MVVLAITKYSSSPYTAPPDDPPAGELTAPVFNSVCQYCGATGFTPSFSGLTTCHECEFVRDWALWPRTELPDNTTDAQYRALVLEMKALVAEYPAAPHELVITPEQHRETVAYGAIPTTGYGERIRKILLAMRRGHPIDEKLKVPPPINALPSPEGIPEITAGHELTKQQRADLEAVKLARAAPKAAKVTL